MSDLVKHVSDSTFEKDVLQSDNPVLEDIARDYAGRLTVAKLDVDANPEVTNKFGIRGIPTIILYKGGQVEAQKVGALSKSQLTAFLDSHL